jgi:hypothetical protein
MATNLTGMGCVGRSSTRYPGSNTDVAVAITAQPASTDTLPLTSSVGRRQAIADRFAGFPRTAAPERGVSPSQTHTCRLIAAATTRLPHAALVKPGLGPFGSRSAGTPRASPVGPGTGVDAQDEAAAVGAERVGGRARELVSVRLVRGHSVSRVTSGRCCQPPSAGCGCPADFARHRPAMLVGCLARRRVHAPPVRPRTDGGASPARTPHTAATCLPTRGALFEALNDSGD